MNDLYEFQITLKVQAPVLTQSSDPSAFGLDAAAARDAKTGAPILPGTLVEGKLREALGEIGEAADDLFGTIRPGNVKDPYAEPVRGELVVGDLLCETPEPHRAVRGEEHAAPNDEKPVGRASRAAIEGILGSAKAEALRVIEMPHPPRTELSFKGCAWMICDQGKAADVQKRLLMGLRWLAQVGSLRTTGFGRVLGAEVEATKVDARPESISTAPAALDLEITPLGPLCIARHKIGDNLFETEKVIPGNMLAGAIMQTAKALGIDGKFGKHFSEIRFRHGFPSMPDGARAKALPLSTVVAGEHGYDVSSCARPVLLKDQKDRLIAPKFPIDWKDAEYGKPLRDLGWAQPMIDQRGRTAIDSSVRMADKGDGSGGKLFVWEMLQPFDGEKQPVVWRTRIDLPPSWDADTRKRIAQALADVLARLCFVSKTKARCSVKVKPTPSPERVSVTENTLALVLQTPALLADPRFPVPPTSGAISSEQMFASYRAAWSEISGQSLELLHHFASQSMAGGRYLYHRFQKTKNNGIYDPWLLTDAGSVFVFAVKNEETAKEKLENWLARGLDLPGWAITRFTADWQHNPYRPQNGFGEVAIHKPLEGFKTPDPTNSKEVPPITPPAPTQ